MSTVTVEIPAHLYGALKHLGKRLELDDPVVGMIKRFLGAYDMKPFKSPVEADHSTMTAINHTMRDNS